MNQWSSCITDGREPTKSKQVQIERGQKAQYENNTKRAIKTVAGKNISLLLSKGTNE